MSAAPVIIIITRPKKQHEKLGESQTVEVLEQPGDTASDLLRRAADQLEDE